MQVFALPDTADASIQGRATQASRDSQKMLRNQAAFSYTSSTANKQTFLLHWQAKCMIANNLSANDANWYSSDPGLAKHPCRSVTVAGFGEIFTG